MFNKSILMGRLTADPELRQTQNGVSTCQITVAVDRDYTPRGQEKQADFINVVAWRQTAEFISKYFGKGKMILVEGRLHTRTYDDKRYPDVKHYVTEVYADQVYFAGDKSSQSATQQPQSTAQAPQATSYTQQQTAPQNAPQTAVQMSMNDLSDFEVVGDSNLPF